MEENEVVDKIEDVEETKESKETQIKIDVDSWKPKTLIGKKVKDKEIKDLSELLDKGTPILEPEIVDVLLPNTTTELILIGQSKGKFGGGQRRVFKQTQKKTKEGNKPKFATMAVIGNGNGYIGIGYGKSKETVPAREKAIRKAKLEIIKIVRGCGSWECGCKQPHTIPYKVTGKRGSIIMTLMPAPKGTGLKIHKECQKILRLAGIKDVWSKTKGQTKSTINLINACFDALKNLQKTRTRQKDIESLGIVIGQQKDEKDDSSN